MPNLTGARIPTWKYPRFVWTDDAGVGRTIDFDDPVNEILPEDVPTEGVNTTSSGERSVLHERTDVLSTLTFTFLDALKAQRVRRMLLGLKGRQVEVYIDRVLRAWWGFEDHAEDHNGGNAFRRSDSGALSYVDLAAKRAVTLPGAGVLSAPASSDLPGGGGNQFFNVAEGILVVVLKPAFASDDGADHVLLDVVNTVTQDRNRLIVRKRADNLLHVVYVGGNGMETIAEANVAAAQPLTWAANSEHTVMIEWGATLAEFRVKWDSTELATRKYPIVASGSRISGTGLVSGQIAGATPNGGEQVMNAAPTTIALGSDVAALWGRWTGSVGMLALYASKYGAAFPEVLKTYYVFGRTYFPRGEIGNPRFAWTRRSFGRDLFGIQLAIRDGS